MLEKIISFTIPQKKVIEQLVGDDEVMINHIALEKGDTVPIHFSDSNVYLIVVQGTITFIFDDQKANHHTKGSIVKVPFHTKMNISNTHDELGEFFIIKAPHPRKYKESLT
ncbi:MAG TPA: cupin domain-containing protein [Sphaerochaeta sp.]|nr:cupin domain-containing protein [Sphaerochaeta sp.]